MAEITSAYEAFEAVADLDWDDIHDATDLMDQALDEIQADSKVRELIFSEELTDGVTVHWRTDVPAGNEDAIKRVAEFAEAGVIDPSKGKLMFAKIDAYATALRVSYEQTKLKGGKAVQRELTHLARSIQMHDSRSALDALNAAVNETDLDKKVESLAATTPWTNPDANPLDDDLLRANELIMSAEKSGIQYGYTGNVLWVNPVTGSRLKNNKSIRDLYVGNIASENPTFNESGVIAGQFTMIPDPALPLGDAYLLQGGDVSGSTVGTEFVWEDGQAEISAFYADGEGSRGGRTRSFRADYSKWNKHGLRAPKAIVKLTNLV